MLVTPASTRPDRERRAVSIPRPAVRPTADSHTRSKPMTPKVDAITLGVTDLARAQEFYERGFGGTVRPGDGALTVSLGPGSSRLVLRQWETVAVDAGVEAGSSGFRAFTLSYIVESADDVELVLAGARRHGGRISKPPKNALWGYSAYVTDPSGYLWKIASAKRRPLLGGKAP